MKLTHLIFIIALECISFGIIAFTLIFGLKLEPHIITGVFMSSLFFFMWAEVLLNRHKMQKTPLSSELSPLYESEWKKLAKVAFNIILWISVFNYAENVRTYFGEIILKNLFILTIGILWGVNISKVWYKFR